ncbi:MAG TPA: transketolase [Acidimicrobiales bacterium]
MVDSLYPGASDLEGRTIREIVAVAMDAPAKAKSGHSGTAMALAPLAVMLWARIMRHDPTDPQWSDRDRFILSNGHASILQYSLAHEFGYDLTVEDLKNFRQPLSRTPGHPERGHAPTVEVTTGPLGQGMANGVGMAIAERILRSDYGDDLVNHRTWVFAGDGCFEEGISHESASLAGSLGLDRLTVFYDDNHITIDGPTELALHDHPAERFAAYGWHVIDVGEHANELDVLEEAVRAAIAETSRPSLIIVRSHIGFPSPEMMDRREAHGNPFSTEAITNVKEILGVPDEAFHFDPELPRELVELISPQRVERVAWEARVKASGPKGAALLEQLDTNGAAKITTRPEPFAPGSKVATRKGMQRAMDAFAPQTPGLTAGSADLTENTGVELKASLPQGAANPGGRQIHYGIREFGMSGSLVGQAHHGGLRPAGSTFFVFSDYARGAVRLAALSQAGVLFVYTHDSIGVGEDGPTHEPIEHLMSLRAMPNLHVVRPSDANETIDLVEQFLTAKEPHTTALVLSRQDMPVFNEADGAASAKGARKGGYVIRESDNAVFTLVATGSEVGLCLSAADELSAKGIVTRVVALPCWRCFDAQPREYRDQVLRRSIPSVAIEAGATLGWANYVDDSIGINSFGLSAPASFIFDYFNIVPATVVAHVERALSEGK